MAKDAYYFSHDSNAKDDPKCVLLIEQLGLEGYGIFWMLIETLRDQPSYKYPVALIPALARRYNTTTEKTKTVINSYGLFTVDDEQFFSLSLMQRMEKLDAKRDQARAAGLESARKRLALNVCSTDVQQTLDGSLTSKVNKSKVNESVFNEFWGAYPKKKSKQDAVKAFNKINPDTELFNKILFALNFQKKSKEWTKDNGQFIPYPASWLNGKRWEDEVGGVRQVNSDEWGYDR